MKNFSTKHAAFFLLSITIPIHTKISIPNISTKVSSFFSRSKEEVTHQEFNNVSRLEIICEHGPLTIESWKQNCVLVELKKKGNAQFLQNIELKSDQKDQNLSISTILKDAAISGHASLRILVPKNLPIKVTTTDGNITIKKASGPVEINTIRGAISLIEGSNTVIAKTVHGNIIVQQKQIQSDYVLNLHSEHGNITLAVPQDVNADLQAHTKSGKIHSDLFITLHPQTILLDEEYFKNLRHHVHGMIGQPMQHQEPATVLLSSDYGTIKICAHDALPSKK